MLRILLHFLFRNSCPTMPLTRVPTGSPALLIKTQALSSNLTTLPSLLVTFCFVRTTTACLISPRLTLPDEEEAVIPAAWLGDCFWTTTTIRSPIGGTRQPGSSVRSCHRSGIPIEANFFWPMIWMHSTTAAPELSMQLINDCQGQENTVSCCTRKRRGDPMMMIPLVGASCLPQLGHPLLAAGWIGVGRLKRDVISRPHSRRRAKCSLS